MLKEKWLKRWTIFSALLLIFALVGCNAPQTPTSTASAVPADPPVKATDKRDLNPDLIESMVDYLEEWRDLVSIDSLLHLFAYKIYYIVDQNRNPFHVKLDSLDFYYACGYAALDAEHAEREKKFYCCLEDYTWVRFENEADIPETYNMEQLVVVFQINKAAVCQNILQDAWDGSTMEHYQLYTPKFENGKNVAPAIELVDEFIFLSDSQQLNQYCGTGHAFFKYVTIPCIELDGKCYLPQRIYSIDLYGQRHEADLRYQFGMYYDDLMEIMITDRYSVTQENGTVAYYGLFELGEFADFLRSRIVQTE